MLEKGTSGLMSGEGKRAAASRPRTALFLDSTRISAAISALAERNIETAGNGPILSWHFRRATPFDTLIIVIILVAGLGVIGRSQRSAHA